MIIDVDVMEIVWIVLELLYVYIECVCIWNFIYMECVVVCVVGLFDIILYGIVIWVFVVCEILCIYVDG